MVRINIVCANMCLSVLLIVLSIYFEGKSVYANSEEGKAIIL
jgi:hypothetical protein